MSLYQRRGSEVWYVDIRRPGRRRIRCSTGTRDRVAAQQQHDELAARAWKERDGGKRVTDALAIWLDAQARSRQELSALKQIRARYPDRALREVTAESVADAFGDLSAPTYNRLVTVLRAALNLAAGRGWMPGAVRIARRKVRERSVRWLTPDEWMRLRAHLALHVRPLADFALATGLRWGNVARLTWAQVDLAGRRCWIDAASAKGGRAIAVPLSAAAMAVLEAQASGRADLAGPVFTYRGEALGSVKTAWRNAHARANAAARKAGLPLIAPVRWHDLRHTWASWHVQNGTPLAVLRELGAWASLDQVQIYAHLAPSHVAHYANNATAPRAAARKVA